MIIIQPDATERLAHLHEQKRLVESQRFATGLGVIAFTQVALSIGYSDTIRMMLFAVPTLMGFGMAQLTSSKKPQDHVETFDIAGLISLGLMTLVQVLMPADSSAMVILAIYGLACSGSGRSDLSASAYFFPPVKLRFVIPLVGIQVGYPSPISPLESMRTTVVAATAFIACNITVTKRKYATSHAKRMRSEAALEERELRLDSRNVALSETAEHLSQQISRLKR